MTNRMMPKNTSWLRLAPALVAVAAIVALAPAASADHLTKLKQTEVSGTITAVDGTKGTVTIKGDDGQSLDLGVIEETRIMVGGKAGALLDIKPNSKAKVAWVELPQDKKKVAATITVP